MAFASPRPQKAPLVNRALPYLSVVDLFLRIADRTVHFSHAHGSGSHRLTSDEVTTLNNGGTVVFKDQSGNEHYLTL